MTLGSGLVGGAIVLVLVAYLAQPFRRERQNWDRAIEAWVRQARAGLQAPASGAAEPAGTETPAFCPYCGRPVAPDHRFCPRCGKPLSEGDVGAETGGEPL